MAEGRPVKLPFLTEVLRSRINKRRTSSVKDNLTVSTPGALPLDSPVSAGTPLPNNEEQDGGLSGTVKYGELIKTSRSRSNEQIQGPARRRRFRLTEEAIEYFQQFSQVKVRKSFPLTSILKVEFVEDSPATFRLVFKNFLMDLEASNIIEASEWVQAIQRCVSKWKGEDERTIAGMSQESLLLEGGEINYSLSQTGKRDEDIMEVAEDDYKEDDMEGNSSDECPFPQDEGRMPTTPETVVEKAILRPKPKRPVSPGRTRSKSLGVLLKSMSSEEDKLGTYGQRRANRISVRRKLHLVPKLEKHRPIVQNSSNEEEEHYKKLHEDFAMIKYPRSKWGTIPTEKLFRLDKDNLQIMWRRNLSSKAKITSTLRLDSILEVRVGQQTDGFEKFPYEEVAEQSFSLMYEEMKGKYARLGSLDLICDHPLHYQEWMKGLGSLQIGPLTAMFPTRYENTDPILIWLKRFWSCCSVNHEMHEKDSLHFMSMLSPRLTKNQMKQFLNIAHTHQHEASLGHGNSLRWDGFVLLFNLLCGETGRLNEVYRQYAKTHKRLGMTIEEFKSFLIQECYFKEEDCYQRRLKELIAFHDHHHRSFKKYVGNNKPSNWKISTKLLSYAGFLSFLRSKHNAVVNPLTETIHHDMDQPLSHYFINSSHNTYLEADQIKGRSTLDAYTRALVQGCRCVEIDCWDNTTGKEPIIYHGFTFTSKLPCRAVIRTINRYAFHMSHFPLIISIENHCSDQQQARMAKIFREEFVNELGNCIVAIDNLVEGNDVCKRRLPSPNDLQGKILLKGSYKIRKAQGGKLKKMVSGQTSTIPSRPLSQPVSANKLISKNPRTESVLSDGELDRSPTYKDAWVWPEPSETQPINKGSVILTRGKTRREAKRFSDRIKETQGNIETPEDDQELEYTETSKDLQRLIVCQSTSIKPWSWKEQRQTSVCQMFSFSEISASNHCRKSPKEMLTCSERQLVRTYPKGARIDSSNYNPIPFWYHGIHMVALNYQTPDLYMHLNQGFFRQNGGCGYILKPEIMRRANTSKRKHPFDPLMMEPHPLIPCCKLDIELLSGQNLTFFGKSCTSISVQISTHGIDTDNHSMEPAESTEVFWPTWPSGAKRLSYLIIMPELCLVYFRVDCTLRGASRTTQIFGQNCIAVSSLQQGVKYVQLRKTGGELIPESGLFVKIKMDWDNPATPPPPTPQHPTTTPVSSTQTRRSQFIHQEEIDVEQSLAAASILQLKNRNTDQNSKQGQDDISLVNLLDVDPTSPDEEEVVPICNEGVGLDENENEEYETQTVSLRVEAEVH